MTKKSNIDSLGLVMNVILTLTDEEMIVLILSSPQSLTDLCIIAALEDQMLHEEKL